MDCENGRRLNTNANVLDDRGEKPTPPFSIANSDRSSTSSRTVTSHGGNGSSPAKISETSHNVALRVEASSRSAASAVTSPESAKRSSDIAHDSFVLTESPSVQVMERPKPSDPNSADDSPNRWSVDSNDSLFSLRMGNDSFTKDHSLSISGEMHGIGELSLSEAYLPRVSSSHRSESRNSPSVKAIDETTLKDVKEDSKPGYKEPNLDPPEASISIHTDSNLSQSSDPHALNDDSKSRAESFPSPSRKESSSCPMCRYWCCNKMDRCCRWPSCSSCCSWFKWPNCSNTCSSCPSCCSCCSKCYASISFSSCCCCCCCFGWKREPKRVRSVSSYALMDRNLASSSKHNL